MMRSVQLRQDWCLSGLHKKRFSSILSRKLKSGFCPMSKSCFDQYLHYFLQISISAFRRYLSYFVFYRSWFQTAPVLPAVFVTAWRVVSQNAAPLNMSTEATCFFSPTNGNFALLSRFKCFIGLSLRCHPPKDENLQLSPGAHVPKPDYSISLFWTGNLKCTKA